MPTPATPRRHPAWTLALIALGGAVALLLTLWLGLRAFGPEGSRRAPEPGGASSSAGPPPPAPAGSAGPASEAPLPPSTGWEEAAETLVTDAQRLLEGRAHAGAFAEAQAEAAREDLALYPPPVDRLRRALVGSERERTWALAALAARPPPDDDLVRLVLRSQRPEDDEVVRLLGAEVVAGLPPELLSRHEEELLAAFEQEENPLVLALALPALERLDEARLRALLAAQLARASPEMRPVLRGLARDRLGDGAPDGR